MDSVLMYTASREPDTETGWFEGRMAVRRTDWIEGCGADRVLTDPGVIRDWFWGAKHG